MRRLITVAAAATAVGALACASASPLPGGPPDTAPPQVVSSNPDSGAVGFRGSAVTVQFDETISDRGTGATALEALVTISPREGEPRVAWSRNRIAIRPRNGFRPNTAYTITVGPGVPDLRGNRMVGARTIVFSTGATIPTGTIRGVAFDWPGQAFARTSWIEALRIADSAVFVTAADTAGGFALTALSPGAYVVRGYVDQNRNRALDRTEAWDSARVVIGEAPVTGVELLLAARDTLPAGLASVTVQDSVTLGLEFDKPLDPEQSFGASQIGVVRADSTPVPVAALAMRAAYDSARLARPASAMRRDSTPLDSLRRDSTRPDSTRLDSLRRDSTRLDSTRLDSLRRDGTRADSIRVDSARSIADAAARARRPSRPAPPRAFVVTLAEPLRAGETYRVTATGFRSLLGRTAPSSRVITVPLAPASVRPDSASRAPGRSP